MLNVRLRAFTTIFCLLDPWLDLTGHTSKGKKGKGGEKKRGKDRREEEREGEALHHSCRGIDAPGA